MKHADFPRYTNKYLRELIIIGIEITGKAHSIIPYELA